MTHTKTTSLDPKLQKQFASLDKKLNLLLEELKDYSEDQLNRKPGPGKWSVIQVMHHLLLAEKGSYNYIQKKLSFNPTLKNTNLITWFRKKTLSISQKLPLKYKAPKGVGDEYLPDVSGFWDTAKEWKDQRTQLIAYLETLPPEIFKKEVYKHPAVGRLGVLGMVDFFHGHFDRHLKQIRGIVKDYSKQV